MLESRKRKSASSLRRTQFQKDEEIYTEVIVDVIISMTINRIFAAFQDLPGIWVE
jgi:hypothetical protein